MLRLVLPDYCLIRFVKESGNDMQLLFLLNNKESINITIVIEHKSCYSEVPSATRIYTWLNLLYCTVIFDSQIIKCYLLAEIVSYLS